MGLTKRSALLGLVLVGLLCFRMASGGPFVPFKAKPKGPVRSLAGLERVQVGIDAPKSELALLGLTTLPRCGLQM